MNNMDMNSDNPEYGIERSIPTPIGLNVPELKKPKAVLVNPSPSKLTKATEVTSTLNENVNVNTNTNSKGETVQVQVQNYNSDDELDAISKGAMILLPKKTVIIRSDKDKKELAGFLHDVNLVYLGMPDATEGKIYALHLLARLAGKGACSKNTPGKIKSEIVIVINGKDKVLRLRKTELLDIHKKVLKNKKLRHTCKLLSSEICNILEEYNLEGDLARKMEKVLGLAGERPLTRKERAYCNSFNQNSVLLNVNGLERVKEFLKKDHSERMSFFKEQKVINIKRSKEEQTELE
jgi:hypothetical protein